MSSPTVAVAPSSYAPLAAAFDSDFTAQLAVILKYLPLSQSLHDVDRSNFYLRRLLALLDQRFDIPPTPRIELLHSTLSLLYSAQELHLQIRSLQVATSLLRTQADLPSLTIPWRPLFSLLSSLHFPSARTFTYPQTLLKQHSTQLVKFIHAARRYFPPTTGAEVWAEFSPFLSPFDNASTRSFSLIALFTPTHTPEHGAAFVSTLPTLLQYEGWYEHSPSALLPFFSLYARLSKHQVASFSLLPHLPSLYNAYLQLLELDVGSAQSANHTRTVYAYPWLNEKHSNALEEISQYLAQITVYHLHRVEGKERSALSLLSQFLHTVNTYYHPSNQGKWSNPLGSFLAALGVQYAKRKGKELTGKAKYPSTSFLPPDNNDFVSVLLPIALQALFSKSHSMVAAAERWLKHVAYFHPSLVLPALLAHVYPALDDLSSPHRMLSIMQSLSQLAPILFHREYFPQGGQHLDPLLNACLPGVDAIDAMKTSLTLTWFTIVFYNVPFVDARKSEALRRSTSEKGDAAKPRVIERITSRFVEVSDSGAVEVEDTDVRPMDEDDEDASEDDAKATTFRFEDWAFAFLDSLFKVLSAADKFAKSDVLDVHTARLLGKVMRAFFACQSADIFLSCANLIIKKVLGQQQTNATKQWGIIVHTASHIHPEVMLPKLFDPLYSRLVSVKGGVKTLNPLAKSDLDWSVYLASQVVKLAGGASGSHVLLPYREKVVALHRLTCDHEERSVRKVSGKLLRNYIASLCLVYPSEWRPFDNRQWSDVERWQHWNLWCTYTPEDAREDVVVDPRIEWHVPSEEEMAVVDDLVNTQLTDPLTTLSRFIDATDDATAMVDTEEKAKDTKAGKGDGPIERALLRVANIIRGSQFALGDIAGQATRVGEKEGEEEGDEQDPAAVEAAFTGARCPLVTVKRSRPLRAIKNSLTVLPSTGGESIRSALLPFLHRLTEQLLSSAVGGGNSSLKALTLHIRLLSLTLLAYGVSESKLNAEQYIAGFTRSWMREYRSGFRVAARPLLIQRAYHYHLTRISDASRSQVYTEQVRTILGDLHRLSTNDFGRVRQKAHKALVASIFHFPQSIDYTLTNLTQTLSSPTSTTEQISGALSILADPTIIALSSRRWTRLTLVIDTLAKGTGLKEDKTEVLLQAYFTALFPTLYPLPVAIPSITSPPPDVDAVKVERRNTALTRFNAANTTRYRTLITSLLGYAQDQQLHWRYQLMATAFLFVLLKPSALLSPSPTSPSPASLYDDVIAFFLRTLLSELAPMRHIANEALANILGMHFVARHLSSPASSSTATPTASITPSSPGSSVTRDGVSLDIVELDEPAWLSTVFYDYLYSGWQDEAAVSTWYTQSPGGEYRLNRTASPYFTSIPPTLHPDPTPLSATALSNLSTFLSAHLPALFSSLVNHHPTLEAKIEGSSSSSSAQGAGDTIATLATSHFAAVLWPFTRIQVQSKAFDFVHCALIRGLVEAQPSLIDEGGLMEVQVKALLSKSTELDSQCTAAEVIAGIIKASKHMTLPRQKAMQAWLLPVLLNALTSAPPDSVSHWTAALRFVYSNLDPRRIAWLTRPLLLASFGSLPNSTTSTPVEVTSPLVQYKRFHFLTPVLVEQGFRCASLCGWILDRIIQDRWLFSPFKQVRSEVAWLVFLSIENHFKVSTLHGQLQLVPAEAVTRFLSQTNTTLQTLSASLHKGGDRTGEETVGEGEGSGDVEMEVEGKRGEEKKDDLSNEGKLYLETILSSTLVSLLAGSVIASSSAYQVYLPHIIQSQHVTDIECAALGRQVAKVAAWASLKGNVTTVEGEVVQVKRPFDTEGVIANVVSEVSELMALTAVSWHVKVSALKYLQVLIPRHSLLMTAQHVTDLESTVLTALTHPQVEVREAAALTLQSLLSSCLSHPPSSVIGFSSSTHASTHVQRLVKQLMTVARTNYRDKAKKVDGALLSQRHGGVLGLLACIACHPYDLPRHLPAVLAVLSGYVNDPQPVSGAVRKGFAEFLRTHKEEWEAFKEKFTPEQLEAVNSVQSAPTYFA